MTADDQIGAQPSRRDARRAEQAPRGRRAAATKNSGPKPSAKMSRFGRVERPAPTEQAGRRSAAPAAAPAPQPVRVPSTVRRTGPLRVFATVLVVPAIIGTVALPAYALVPGVDGFGTSSLFRDAVTGAQQIDVSALASKGPVSSDAYSVTTKAEIDRLAAEAERSSWSGLANRAGAFYTPAQQAEGDDYPWWDQTPDDYGGGLSPLRYYFRECVDFVAWRMNRDAGVTSAPWKWDWGNLASGSAYAWADQWVAHGWATSSTPIVGSVAWFPYNHVAYVQSVNDNGTVTIEEYNWNSDHSYHVRTIDAGSALYLYPPV
ncbi:CHAP domain-containing protein [Agromyces sp. MMS24-JH15]|uniref:CHAP domain-containing protein n=1 Tax=Agromyces sp. MMS24-JH15 TaxID=3243765 RepID=UPI003749539E